MSIYDEINDGSRVVIEVRDGGIAVECDTTCTWVGKLMLIDAFFKSLFVYESTEKMAVMALLASGGLEAMFGGGVESVKIDLTKLKGEEE